MNDATIESLPYVQLVIPDDGIPTLMPCWNTLESLSVPFNSAGDSSKEGEGRSGRSSEEANPGRILVIIHAYYPNLLEDLLPRLTSLSLFQDLVITTDTQEKAHRIEALHLRSLGRSSRLQVEVLPNVGRDVWPFWRVLEKHGAEYDYFLKLHLKRSTHWEELGYWNALAEGKDAGSAWNEDCFDCLIPANDAECRSLLHWMKAHGLGAFFPRPHRIVASFGWVREQNMVFAAQILAELRLQPLHLLRPLFFPAGNMFWGAMASFLPFAPYFLEAGRYPAEPLALDGTFLHAVERCYGYLLTSAGNSVGFLFPPLNGADSSGLRGVKVEGLMTEESEVGNAPPLMEPVLLHRLYSTPASEWRGRAQRAERELQAIKEVIHSMEQTRWGRLKARYRRLIGGSHA